MGNTLVIHVSKRHMHCGYVDSLAKLRGIQLSDRITSFVDQVCEHCHSESLNHCGKPQGRYEVDPV